MSDNKTPDKNAPKTPKVAPKVANKPSSATAPKVAPKPAPKVAPKPAPKTNAPKVAPKVAPVKSASKPATTTSKPNLSTANKTATAPKVSPVVSKVSPVESKETPIAKTVESKPENIKVNKSAIKTNPIRPQTKTVDASNVAVKTDDGDKKKKRRRLLLLLLLLLVFVSSIGLAIYFISKNTPAPEIKFSVDVLSSDVVTEIVDPNDQTVTKIEFLPGDPITANLNIKVVNDNGKIKENESVFLRFKIDVVVDDNSYYNFFSPSLEERYDGEKWTCGDKTLTEYNRGKSFDGYYYFNSKCYGGEEIQVFKSIDFIGEMNNNDLNGKEGKMIFTIEILQGDHSAINDHWQTAPTTWRRKVR